MSSAALIFNPVLVVVPGGLPLLAVDVKVADQFFSLCVDGDHGLARSLRLAGLAVDVAELDVAVRMRRAFAIFDNDCEL